MIEDKIQNAIKPIIAIYNQIELDMIAKIAKHFNLNEEFINSDYWYLEKLKELGGLNNETLKLLEKYTGKTRKELLKAMQDIGINVIPTEQLNLGQQKGLLLNPQSIINNINIQNVIKHSYDEIEKTFLQLNKTIEEQVKKTYTDIITQTYIKTLSGTYSYQEAILESLDDLGNKGIAILQYQTDKGVRNYDVVGTVRRDLLCATRGLAAKVNEEVIKESGNHIVRVSHHFGARTGDGENNYTNHAWWQEKQFFCWDYDGKASKEEKKLPDFMQHCNYGHVQGIVGINCKHFFTVWYGSLEKDKLDFTYEENEEQYEKQKQQRYLENGVRKWKRKQVIASKTEDKEGYEKASKKAKEWQERLKIFTDENELKRDYTREHIKGYKNVANKDAKYVDITYITLKNGKKEYELKEQEYFIDENSVRYDIDGRNVRINANEKERAVANLMGQTYGGQVNLVPVVLNPKGIKTPDYIINGEKFDLKEIFGNGKNTLDTAISKKKKQSNNFIFDITNTEMLEIDAIKQIQKIYKSNNRTWVEKVLLIKDNKILKIYKRK